MSSLMLIDGSGFVHRAFHAYPPLRRPSDNHPVGAVIGFCSMLWRLLRDVGSSYSHIAVAFERSRSTHRLAIDPAYKGNRGGAPDDLKAQFPLAREAAMAFGVAIVEEEGHEADDVIATYATLARERVWLTKIISSDKDLLQLTEPHIEQWCPQKREHLRAVEKFGVEWHQVVDLQALVGDPVDNIIGAPGIGPKTAAALLAAYPTLDQLLAAACDPFAHVPCRAKQRLSLINYADQIRRARELVRLKRDVPITTPLDDLVRQPMHMPTIDAFLARMESVTLRNEICPAVQES